jgi:hypothetical protein
MIDRIALGHGRLLTAFADHSFQMIVYEELILPYEMRWSIRSITYRQVSVDKRTSSIVRI